MPLTVPAELIEAARSGDAPSLDRLLELAWPHAFRIARSIVRQDAAAEDAAQEACALIYRKIASLRDSASFRAWFYRIVVREASAALRRVPCTEPLGQLDARESLGREAALDIQRALARLPWKMRAALVLRYYADLNSKEIGLALDIPSATVRFHLAQALRRMRALLDDCGQSASVSHEVLL